MTAHGTSTSVIAATTTATTIRGGCGCRTGQWGYEFPKSYNLFHKIDTYIIIVNDFDIF